MTPRKQCLPDTTRSGCTGGSWEDLGEVAGEETMIRIYRMKKLLSINTYSKTFAAVYAKTSNERTDVTGHT